MYQEKFYHSFPRIVGAPKESENEHNQRGITILESIIKHGLLITPEIMKLPFELESWHSPLVQHRCCFTLIERKDLENHCKLFGNFSIEWDTFLLKRIGIFPVFYLPIFDFEHGNHNEFVAPKFLYRMMNYHEYARECSKEAKENRDQLLREGGPNGEVIKYEKDLLFFTEMKAWFEGLKNNIYPIDNAKYTKENGYYHQREWKLPGNLKYNNKDIMELATLQQQKELIHLNPTFFSKKINYFNMNLKVAEICLFFKELDSKQILSYANKIIVPSSQVDRVKGIISAANLNVNVEAL